MVGLSLRTAFTMLSLLLLLSLACCTPAIVVQQRAPGTPEDAYRVLRTRGTTTQDHFAAYVSPSYNGTLDYRKMLGELQPASARMAYAPPPYVSLQQHAATKGYPPHSFVPTADVGNQPNVYKGQNTFNRRKIEHGASSRVETAKVSQTNHSRVTCYEHAKSSWCELRDLQAKVDFSEVLQRCGEALLQLYAIHHRGRRDDAVEEAVPACETSRRGTLAPVYARDVDGKWFVVLQAAELAQTVDIEVCRYPEMPCAGLPAECGGRRSRCLQTFSRAVLLSLDPDEPSLCPGLRTFVFPSSCRCRLIAQG